MNSLRMRKSPELRKLLVCKKKIVSHRHRGSYISVSLFLGEIEEKNKENLSFTVSEIAKYTLLVFSPFRSEIFPMTFVGL